MNATDTVNELVDTLRSLRSDDAGVRRLLETMQGRLPRRADAGDDELRGEDVTLLQEKVAGLELELARVRRYGGETASGRKAVMLPDEFPGVRVFSICDGTAYGRGRTHKYFHKLDNAANAAEGWYVEEIPPPYINGDFGFGVSSGGRQYDPSDFKGTMTRDSAGNYIETLIYTGTNGFWPCPVGPEVTRVIPSTVFSVEMSEYGAFNADYDDYYTLASEPDSAKLSMRQVGMEPHGVCMGKVAALSDNLMTTQWCYAPSDTPTVIPASYVEGIHEQGYVKGPDWVWYNAAGYVYPKMLVDDYIYLVGWSVSETETNWTEISSRIPVFVSGTYNAAVDSLVQIDVARQTGRGELHTLAAADIPS